MVFNLFEGMFESEDVRPEKAKMGIEVRSLERCETRCAGLHKPVADCAVDVDHFAGSDKACDTLSPVSETHIAYWPDDVDMQKAREPFLDVSDGCLTTSFNLVVCCFDDLTTQCKFIVIKQRKGELPYGQGVSRLIFNKVGDDFPSLYQLV